MINKEEDLNFPNWQLLSNDEVAAIWIDANRVQFLEKTARIVTKFDLAKHGIDRQNGRPVIQILFTEEFDLHRRYMCVRNLRFRYTNEEYGEIRICAEDWKPVPESRISTIHFLDELSDAPKSICD
jgi:hypothetical protein